MRLLPEHQIAASTTDGDVLTTTGGRAQWGPAAPPAPPSPLREVLMATGVTPPEPLESSDGHDWLYGEEPQ